MPKTKEANAKQQKSKPQSRARKAANKEDKRRAKLSECAKAYSRALVACHSAPPACIPTTPPLDSVKLKVFIKDTFTTSTTGSYTGFAAFDPRQAIASDWVTTTLGDSVPMVVSGGTYAGAGIDVDQSVTGVYAFNSNSPYTQADIDVNSVKWRLVAACLRVKFIGNSLYDGGSMAGMHHPDNTDMDGFTLSDMTSYNNVPLTGLADGKGWQHVFYRPSDSDDCDYSASLHAACRPILAFIAKGDSSNTKLFAFEAHAMFEAIGPNARGKSRSSADPEGFAGAMTAAARATPGALPEKPNRVGSFLGQVESTVKTMTNIVDAGASLFEAVEPYWGIAAAALG